MKTLMHLKDSAKMCAPVSWKFSYYVLMKILYFSNQFVAKKYAPSLFSLKR